MLNSVDPSITYVNPFDSINSTFKTLYPGQTSILRFNLIINETKSFQLTLNLTSTILSDFIEVQKFYNLSIGANYPCLAINAPTDFMYSASFPTAANSAGITVGSIDYIPIDVNNISSSAVIFVFHSCFLMYY